MAWPVFAIIGLLIFIVNFKAALAGLIARITRISHRGISIDIGPLQELAEESVSQSSAEQIEIDDLAENAIQTDPRTALIEAWLRFELAAREILENRGVSDRLRSPFHIIRALRSQNLLVGNLVEVVMELLRLRNVAAHELNLDINSEDARYYVEAVGIAISSIRTNAAGGGPTP